MDCIGDCRLIDGSLSTLTQRSLNQVGVPEKNTQKKMGDTDSCLAGYCSYMYQVLSALKLPACSCRQLNGELYPSQLKAALFHSFTIYKAKNDFYHPVLHILGSGISKCSEIGV